MAGLFVEHAGDAGLWVGVSSSDGVSVRARLDREGLEALAKEIETALHRLPAGADEPKGAARD